MGLDVAVAAPHAVGPLGRDVDKSMCLNQPNAFTRASHCKLFKRDNGKPICMMYEEMGRFVLEKEFDFL